MKLLTNSRWHSEPEVFNKFLHISDTCSVRGSGESNLETRHHEIHLEEAIGTCQSRDQNQVRMQFLGEKQCIAQKTEIRRNDSVCGKVKMVKLVKSVKCNVSRFANISIKDWICGKSNHSCLAWD